MDHSSLQNKGTSNKNTGGNNMIKQIEEAVKIDAVYFPDGVFRDYITKNFDKDNDGFLSRHEIEEARVLDLSFNNYITNLQGIELFSNLEHLVIHNTKIKEFDTSGNHSLKFLDCSNTKIKRLDISNTNLYHLDCSNTKIKKLDIHSSNLSYLDCSNTNIKELNLSKNYSLRELHCEHTEIKELDITDTRNLCYLSCDNIKIEDINFYNSNLMSHLNYLICNNIKFKRFNFSNNYETDKKPLLNSQKLVKREGLEDCSLLRPGHLTMIAGAGGTGKTTLALNIAHNIAYNMSLPTLIISEENPKEVLVNHLI